MKSYFFKSILIAILFVGNLTSIFSADRYWIASSTSNWNNTANWSTTSGGAGGASVPGTSDYVYFNASGIGNCNIDIAVQIDGINTTGYTGVIDLNGNSFLSTGSNSCIFRNGTINDTPGTSVLTANTTGLIRFSGANFGCLVNVSGSIEFSGGIFNQTVTATQNQSSNGIGSGGCTFNSTLNVSNSSSSEIRFSNTNPDTYNGDVILNNTGTSLIRMAYNGTGTAFNGDISVDCNNGTGIYIGQGPSTSTTLSIGTNVSISTSFSAGRLLIQDVTQLGSDDINLTFTGTAFLELRGNTLLGNLNLSVIDIQLQSNIFNGSLNIDKTGGSGNASPGGNTFNGITTLVNNSSGYLGMGNGSADVFNNDLFLVNQGAERILLCQNSAGNQYNGDIYVEQNGSATGTLLVYGGSSSATIASGKSIFIGLGGFTTGYLEIARLTQLGSDAINLNLTGSSDVRLGPNSTFFGDVTITSPNIYAYGATYNNPVTFNKTGGSSNHNSGNQNIFNSTLEINNSSTGYFMVGYNSNDQFNDDVTISCTNTGGISFGWSSGSGTPTLASGANFAIGAGGFTDGFLRFGGFTKLGSEPISLDMPNARFYIENTPSSCVFNSPLTVKASDLYIEGGTFNDLVSFTKTGGSDNHNNGEQNIFNSTLEINQESTRYFMLGYNSNDLFNDDITVNSINSGNINLGYTSGTGTPTLASGKTIFVGGTGFSDGHLLLGNFTQLGSEPLNLSLGNNASFTSSNSIIGGNINVTTGYLRLSGNIFSGTSYFEKTGSSNDGSAGGNTFQNVSQLVNNGSGYLLFGNGNPDIFNADLNISNQGSSTIYIGYNSIGNTVNGNLTVSQINNSSQVRFLESANSTLVVNGNTSLLNNSGSTGSIILYPQAGQLQQNGDLDILNNGSGDNCRIYACNNAAAVLNVTGNVDIVNEPTGNTGEISFGNTSGSTITVDGSCSVINDQSGTSKIIYLGNSGSITFNGTLSLTNNSDANTSTIRLNYSSSSSNSYNENIIIESTIANCDGITFGENTGFGILADTKTITIGSGGFISGDLLFRNFTQIGNTAQTLVTTGTTIFTNRNSDWGGNVNFTGSNMFTHGTTYHGTTYLEKYGSGNDGSNGNNHFIGETELKNIGSGYFLMGNVNPDNFDDNLVMNNNGTGYMYLAHNSAGNSLAGNLTINNTASGSGNHIYIANDNTSNLSITGDVLINHSISGSTGIVYFPNVGDISVVGNVSIYNTSTGGSNTFISGSSGSSPSLNISGDLLFENTASATTTDAYFGNDADYSLTVDGATTLTNNGSGTNSRIYVVNSGTGTFNGEVYLVNHSTATNSEISASNTTNSSSTFNDNISMTNDNVNADGIFFGNSGGTSTLAASKTISIVGGFVAGRLYIRNFTQLGATPQTLVTTGTTRFDSYDSDWGGDVYFTGAEFYTRGTNYRGTAYLEKFSAGNNGSYGGNHFFDNTEIKNLGSGSFTMGSTAPDLFDGNLIMNNLGTDQLHLGYGSNGNMIVGDLTINNNASGTTNNVSVCYSTGSSISIGGNTDISNLHNGTNGDIYFPFSGSIVHSGNINALNNSSGISAQIIFANGGTSSLIIDGITTISNLGGNTTKRIYLGNSGDVTLNGDLSISNGASATNSEVFCNYGSNSINLYNGNIVLVNNDPAADGIQFGGNGGSGTLANGKTVTIGAGGFSAGQLLLRNFQQIGNTPQNIELTNTGTIFNNYDSQWNGSVDFKAPRHFTRGTTYNSDAVLEKTDATNDPSNGGNIYNGITQIINSGSGYFMPANGVGDDFNNDVSFIQNGTGLIHPNYNCASTYAGNINIDYTNGQIYFGAAGNGRAIIDGTIDQYINDLASSTLPLFRDFQVTKSSGDVYLNRSIEITTELDLDQGIVFTTNANLLSMQDNSTVSSVSNAAHIDGPIEKIGNDVFTFPVGDNGYYRPISMSAPSSTSARFRSQYFDVDPNTDGYNDGQKVSTLGYISDCEYWILNRENSSNNVSVTLSYDTYRGACSGVTDPTLLKIARWDGATMEWKDHGNGSSTGTTSGTVTTAGVVTSFSPFTFASEDISIDPLPITLLSFKAQPNGNEVDLVWQTASEINNAYFTVERSSNGTEFQPITTVNGAGNSTETLTYESTDKNPLAGKSYYRLKQTDFNGDFTYSEVEIVTFNELISNVNLYPNPVSKEGGVVNLVFNNSNHREIEIIDQLGKIVNSTFTTTQERITLNLSYLEVGIYYARISENDHIYSVKIILN